MPHGKVTRIESALGFGWLVDDSGMDWFFVREGVAAGFDRLARHARVTFAHEWTGHGPRATEIAPERPHRNE